MIVLPVALLLLPTVTIVAVTVWGWKHNTLGETTQERYDWEFERIVQRIRPVGGYTNAGSQL
jgi:hypothetical protein